MSYDYQAAFLSALGLIRISHDDHDAVRSLLGETNEDVQLQILAATQLASHLVDRLADAIGSTRIAILDDITTSIGTTPQEGNEQ